MNREAAAVLMIISAALAAFTGMYTRMLSERGFTLGQITFIFLLITTVILFITIMIYDRKLLKIRKEHILLFILLGIFKGVTDYTYVVSLNTNTLSYATVLQMTSPLFVMAFAAIIHRKWMSFNLVLSIIVFIVGAVFVSGVDPFEKLGFTWGTTVGLVSGAALAAIVITTKVIINKGYSLMTIVFYAFLIGTLVLVPFTNFNGCAQRIVEMDNLLILVMFSIFCTLIPYIFDGLGMKYLEPMTASVIMTLEVVFSAIVGAWLFSEDLTWLKGLGIVMVILSVIATIKIKEARIDESKSRLKELNEQSREKRRMDRDSME